jgi:hypothetical protein
LAGAAFLAGALAASFFGVFGGCFFGGIATLIKLNNKKIRKRIN